MAEHHTWHTRKDTGTKELGSNNVARDETSAARYYLDKDIQDVADAKSCKAEETKQRIRMKTDGDDRPRQSDTDKCKQYVGIPGRK